METATITIQQKKAYSGNAETHPEGDFYSNGEKYTCWDPIFYATFKEGDTVFIEYTEKTNEHKGKTYINKNISKMSYSPADEVATLTEPLKTPSQTLIDSHISSQELEIVSGRVKIGNSVYEVILRLVNE